MSYKKIKSQPLNKVNKCFICPAEHPYNRVLLLSAISAKGNSLFLIDTTVEHLAVKMSWRSWKKFAWNTTELADIWILGTRCFISFFWIKNGPIPGCIKKGQWTKKEQKPSIINSIMWISPAFRAEDQHSSVEWEQVLDSHGTQGLSFLYSTLALFFSYCKRTPMVSLELISSNKNLRCIKTLLGKNSQEIHICMHKETSISPCSMFHVPYVPWKAIWNNSSKKWKQLRSFIKRRKDNKM